MMKPDSRRDKRTILFAFSLLGLALLFVGGPGPYSSRTIVSAWELGHLLCFALWSILYLHWRTPQKPFRQVVEILFMAFLLGAATELLQTQFGRQASWQDLGSDLLGALLGLFFSSSFTRQVLRWPRLMLQMALLLVVAWSSLPFFKVAIDDLVARQQFPLLAGFETPLELSRWGGNSHRKIERRQVASGFASMQVEFNTSRYSGVALKFFPADWSSYRLLRFQAHNPRQEPFQFYFRIHDQQHGLSEQRYSDRFNTAFTIAPGWNQIEVPLQRVAKAPRGREMDLTKIAGIILFVDKIKQPQTIFLDDIELVK